MKKSKSEKGSPLKGTPRLDYLPPRLRQISITVSRRVLQNSPEDPIEDPEEDW